MSYSPRRNNLRIRPVDEDATKVFVGGLNFSTEPETLEDHFSKFGKLRKAEIIRDVDGRSKGFGFLYYEEENSAADAIEKGHQMEIDGRPVTVSRALARVPNERRGHDRGHDDHRDSRRDDYRSERRDDRYDGPERSSYRPRVGYRVAISGLPESTDWMELKDMLRQAGKVTYANVARPGYGVGEFETLKECEEAIRIFDNTKLHEVTIALKPLNYDSQGHKIPLQETDQRFSGNYAPHRQQGGGGSGGRDYHSGGSGDRYESGGREYDRGGYSSRPSGGYDRYAGGGGSYREADRGGYGSRPHGGYDRDEYDRNGGGYSRGGGYESRGGGGYDRNGGYESGRGGGYDRSGGYEGRGGGYDSSRGGGYERSGGYESRGGGGGGGGGYDRGYDRGSGRDYQGGGGRDYNGVARDYNGGGREYSSAGPERGYGSSHRSAPYDRPAHKY